MKLQPEQTPRSRRLAFVIISRLGSFQRFSLSYGFSRRLPFYLVEQLSIITYYKSFLLRLVMSFFVMFLVSSDFGAAWYSGQIRTIGCPSYRYSTQPVGRYQRVTPCSLVLPGVVVVVIVHNQATRVAAGPWRQCSDMPRGRDGKGVRHY